MGDRERRQQDRGEHHRAAHLPGHPGEQDQPRDRHVQRLPNQPGRRRVRGIAGAAAMSGETIRIDDAYADPRFNRDVDRQTGYRTRSVLSLPVKNMDGEVFAVAQLLNRRDGRPFDEEDEQRFAEFVQSLGVIFETQLDMSRKDLR